MATLTCFAEKSNGSLPTEDEVIAASSKNKGGNGIALSVREKEQVRSRLYFLLEEEEARQKALKERLQRQKELRERIGKLWEAIQAADKEDSDEEEKELRGIEGSNGTKPGKVQGSNGTRQGKEGGEKEISGENGIKRMENPKKVETSNGKGEETTDNEDESDWQTILALENSSYVKELFQNDERLMTWIKNNPEPLHLATQYGNLDLTRFFAEAEAEMKEREEKDKMINAPRELTHFSPLHTALIVRRPSVIKFYLDHPETDLGQKSIWGDNLFHVIFLAGSIKEQGPRKRVAGRQKAEEKVGKWEVLKLLFQSKYFLRTFDLLTTSNNYNETVGDFAERDDMPNKWKVIQLLRRKIKLALQLKNLPKDRLESLQFEVSFEDRVEALLLKALSNDDAESLLLRALFEDEVKPLLLNRLSKEEKESLLIEKLSQEEAEALLLEKLSKGEVESLFNELSEDKGEFLDSGEDREINSRSPCAPDLFIQ